MRQGRDGKWIGGIFQRLCCGAAFALLPACQPEGPEVPFANYLSTLSMALSIELPGNSGNATVVPPKVAEIQLDVPTDSLARLDFLTLSHCDVQANISRRTTSLGRRAKPSQRLLLSLEYLRLAPQCIAYLRKGNKDSLADTLQMAWRQQQEQLPAIIFNATLGSNEYRELWLENPAPGGYPRVRHHDSVTALRTINSRIHRWLTGDYQALNREFELLLASVAGGEGGRLLQLLSRQGQHLAAADHILRRHMAAHPGCMSTSSAVDLSASIRKNFDARLAPLVTTVGQRLQELQAPISALEAQLAPTLSGGYRRWMVRRNHVAAQAARAPGRHTEQIALLRHPCIT